MLKRKDDVLRVVRAKHVVWKGNDKHRTPYAIIELKELGITIKTEHDLTPEEHADIKQYRFPEWWRIQLPNHFVMACELFLQEMGEAKNGDKRA